jgi:predicted dehydrogenase
MFEEAFNQGYPQELKHFISCVRGGTQPATTGEDGRAVLELLYAAYYAAGAGHKVALPFHRKVARPIDLWLHADAPAAI